MEKVLRTIMKIQGAMDLIQGGRSLYGNVKNRLLPAGANFMTALAGSRLTASGRAAYGMRLAQSRGYHIPYGETVGGAASGASSTAASAASSALTSGATNAAADTAGKSIRNAIMTSLAARGLWAGKGAIASGAKGMYTTGMGFGSSVAAAYAADGMRGAARRAMQGMSGAGIGRAVGGATGNIAARTVGSGLVGQAAGTAGGSALGGYVGGMFGGGGAAAGGGGAAAAAGGGASGVAGAAGTAAGGAGAAAVALPFALAALAATGTLFAGDFMNSSPSEGGSMAGNFFNRKYTVGGYADKGGQVIAKLIDSLSNLTGSVLGASRTF